MPQRTRTSGVRRWATSVLGVLAVVFVALLYAHRFRDLYNAWNSNDNYSHGFLVPFVSGWLAWGCCAGRGGPAGAQPSPGCSG